MIRMIMITIMTTATMRMVTSASIHQAQAAAAVRVWKTAMRNEAAVKDRAACTQQNILGWGIRGGMAVVAAISRKGKNPLVRCSNMGVWAYLAKNGAAGDAELMWRLEIVGGL